MLEDDASSARPRSNGRMDTILVPLLQAAGAVALAVIAFSLAFTWTALRPALDRLDSERSRVLGYLGLGAALVVAASVVYLVPGLLLRDMSGLAFAIPLVAVWLIAAIALVVTGFVQRGAARMVSSAFATISAAGAVAGIVSAICVQRGLVDRVTPTGAFLLVIAGIAAIVVWSGRDVHHESRGHGDREPRFRHPAAH
jgi:hypothetical protein